MSCGSAGLPNCACHLSATQVWGLPLIWERMKSSTRVWCQSNQPMGLHASLGRFRRSASESPWSAGRTKVCVLKVTTFATTVCTSILMLLSPCSCYLELGGCFPCLSANNAFHVPLCVLSLAMDEDERHLFPLARPATHCSRLRLGRLSFGRVDKGCELAAHEGRILLWDPVARVGHQLHADGPGHHRLDTGEQLGLLGFGIAGLGRQATRARRLVHVQHWQRQLVGC